jgi:hypothetical protein
MATTERLFMTSQVLLRIIQSRLHSQGLSQAGVPSKFLPLCSSPAIPFKLFVIGALPYPATLMDFVVAEHELSPTTCWTLSIQRLYGMSMELTMTFWYVLLVISESLFRSILTANLQPFTHDFPRADIYEILTPDLLHQLIKGTFKDHLVTWVGEYLSLEHGEARANEILDDIDRRFVLSINSLIIIMMST